MIELYSNTLLGIIAIALGVLILKSTSHPEKNKHTILYKIIGLIIIIAAFIVINLSWLYALANN